MNSEVTPKPDNYNLLSTDTNETLQVATSIVPEGFPDSLSVSQRAELTAVASFIRRIGSLCTRKN